MSMHCWSKLPWLALGIAALLAADAGDVNAYGRGGCGGGGYGGYGGYSGCYSGYSGCGYGSYGYGSCGYGGYGYGYGSCGYGGYGGYSGSGGYGGSYSRPYSGYGYSGGWSGYGYSSGWSYPYSGGWAASPSYSSAGMVVQDRAAIPSSNYVSSTPANGTSNGNAVNWSNQDNTALVEINVPANARVWFNDGETTQTGAVRHFVTPTLPRDKTATYEVRASWMESGQPVTRTQQLRVEPGKRATLSFTPATTTH